MDYKLVEVNQPNKTGVKYAKVSPEDFELVSSLTWRQCSSGYAVSTKRTGGTMSTTYMHKLVHGASSRHVNGDRLDNTRVNLISSNRGKR